MNKDSLCIQYSITAQLSGRNDSDVTRLVATEQVRNKYSLLRSFALYKITLHFDSIILNGTVDDFNTFSLNGIIYIQKLEL